VPSLKDRPANEPPSARGDANHLLEQLRSAEAPLVDLVAELIATDRMASIGALAAGVAHEINNPLAAVIANVELAIDEIKTRGAPGTSRDLIEGLEDAKEAAHRVRQIVRDLRLFSRAEEERKSVVDVRDVLESTLRMAWNEIRHRAKLVKAFEETRPVDVNEARLGQVFLNLVLNAAHAIEPGRVETNEIRVSAHGDGPEVVVTFEDTGSGMSSEVMERIFVPFFTTRPSGIGRGLGLPISQRIVEEIGGRIEVKSRVGHGSTFTVRIPAAGEREASIPVSRPLKSRSKHRARVLVVDDEPLVASAVRRTLTPDYDVAMEQTSAGALKRIARGERFDVILCDVMMPNQTGVDFYRELERIAPGELDRVVFLTGGAFIAPAREFLDSLPNLQLEKPFSPEDLRQVVARMLFAS